MNILMAHNWLFIKGGADRVFFETMKLLERKGHTVIPFSMEDVNNAQTSFNDYFVDKVSYDLKKFTRTSLKTAIKMIYSFEGKKKIEYLIRDTKPDIVHVHNIYVRLTPSILQSCKKNKIPVVMTLHDYKLICPTYDMYANGGPCERCRGNKFYHALFAKCHKNSFLTSLFYSLESYTHQLLKTYSKNVDYFISPSIFMKHKMTNFGIPEDKLEYIPNFIDFKRNVSISSKETYFLYFGKLLRTKGILTLLEAIKGTPDSFLLIAGDGDLRKEVEDFVRQNGIVNARVLGHIEANEISKLVTGSHFVVLPSEWYENAPMSVLEAFAYGKPVLGARIGGIPELIDEGKDGFLFEPGNPDDLRKKIRLMLSMSEHELRRMGEFGREKIRSYFNPELHYERLIALYQRALSN